MSNKQRLLYELSRLRQQRFYAEKECTQIGKMIPACLVLRARAKGTRDFQTMKKVGANTEYSSYAYLTYHAGGKNYYKYIRKERVKEVEMLTDNYRKYCQVIAEVRELNKKITGILDKIGDIQQGSIKEYE